MKNQSGLTSTIGGASKEAGDLRKFGCAAKYKGSRNGYTLIIGQATRYVWRMRSYVGNELSHHLNCCDQSCT